MTEEPLQIDPSLLVRIRLTAHRFDRGFSDRPEALPDEAIVPCLNTELSGEPKFAQVRVAVGKDALFFQLDVQGKTQFPWCRESRMEDSDGLHVWIDARNSREIHRATKFCNRFGFSPMGRGPKADLPFVGWAPINRARENPSPPPDDLMAVRARVADGRYRLVGALHFNAIAGLDVNDFPTIGFYFAVTDRELGWQSLALQPDLPVMDNPSLWAQLKLN
ncbi:DOMON domain-containing protein [Aureliella helgolandensis]|uniref:Carbohydrate-binding domain-containing protein n=1 Tax=Aureliella helgolandensis TaxID=2527968 RepID=A0A518GCJ9_9BACT|nr:hypothetical protein [Aureliella helgolandensis]QDV26319.1 hypothetical protein Q31a_46910 [Aureliella helgolandensis]